MSPELSMYYENYSIKSIAQAFGVKEKSMINRLYAQRKVSGLESRVSKYSVENGVGSVREDRDIIIELLNSGLSVSDIAAKYDVHYSTVSKELKRWGYEKEPSNVESWNLTDIYKDWKEAPEELIITVYKKPMFKLVRI